MKTHHRCEEALLPFLPHSLVDRCLVAAARRLHHNGQLWRANFSVSGYLAGRPLRIPFVFGAGWEHLRMREVWLFHGLERLFQMCTGAFLDVGVNVGQTLIKAKIVDGDREYIGFEPNPNCVQYVHQVIRLNGFRRCTIVPAGLSNCTSVLKLALNPDVDPSATIVEFFREPNRYGRSMLVPVVRGDDALRVLGAPEVGVVKVDVEGGELDVLQGLAGTLRRCEPFVFCEVLPVFDEASGVGRFRAARQARLCELVRDLDYAMYRVYMDERLEEIAEFGSYSDLSLANYVFVPRSRLDLFRRRFAVQLSTMGHKHLLVTHLDSDSSSEAAVNA